MLQGFTSPPVQLNLGDLTLKRSGGGSASVVPAKKLPGLESAASNPLASLPPPEVAANLSSNGAQIPGDTEDPAAETGAAAVSVPVEEQVSASSEVWLISLAHEQKWQTLVALL